MIAQLAQIHPDKLDALIATEVFGHKVVGEWRCFNVEGCPSIDFEGNWKDSGYDFVRPLYVEELELDDSPSDVDKESLILGHNRWDLVIVPKYSTSIEDAWKVIKKMRERGWFDQVGACIEGHPGKVYARFTSPFFPPGGPVQDHTAWSDEDPRAICEAALLAVRSELKEKPSEVSKV